MFAKNDKINIVDFQKEQKRRERKAWFRQKVSDGMEFVQENKDLIVIGTTIGVPIVTGITKLGSKIIAHHKLNQEIKFKETHMYDMSLKRYTELKRKLRPNEALEIERRRNNGEKLNTILESMGLLKH